MVAQATSFLLLHAAPCNNRPHPFLQSMAANESRQPPIRIKRSAMRCLRPGGLAAPEEPWCRFVSNGFYRLVATGFPVPTPGWLTSQAIRFTARVTANGIPFRLVAHRPGPLSGLPSPSLLMQSSASHLRVGAPSKCGSRLGPACGPAP